MPKRPIFSNLRDLDMAVEREITQYLDIHLLPSLFDDYSIITEKEQQLNGKDIVASSVKLKLDNAVIDIKSASHYVNKDLPTFAFELSFLRQHSQKITGWFLDDNKPTQFYLLIWPKAKEESIINYTFEGKVYPYFTCEDITELYYVFVSRNRVREFVAEKGFGLEWLKITDHSMRTKSLTWREEFNKKMKENKHLYFYFSEQLKERPVNLILYRNDLKGISIKNGICSNQGLPSQSRVFTKEKVDFMLNAVRWKTLGEADSKGLIDIAHASNPNKVQKGIAGDVIELSVLGCPKRDVKQEPDILVDGILTELKTTGVRKLKRSHEFAAKECVTITAVSHDHIINEVFEESHFYYKIKHLLFAFYHFTLDGNATNSLDYKSFPILGHVFWNARPDELDKLRNDWLLVQEFCKHHDFNEIGPRKELEKNLLLINYSSPKSPRFRFKTSFATSIINDSLGKIKLESLPSHFNKFSDFDAKCHAFTQAFRGKSMEELGDILGISIGQDKDSCQRIIVKMFGGRAGSINRIRDFQEMGLAAKTVILDVEGQSTEDMKMFQIDFEEFFNPNTVFKEVISEEDSLFQEEIEYSRTYSYFAEQSFIFILFREPRKPEKLANGKRERIPLHECLFEGFKRFSFNENFVDTEVQRCWQDARLLVFSRNLKEVRSGRGLAPNFPKSADYTVFFRGSGSSSKDRKLRMKKSWGIDIPMYLQSIWLKGNYLTEELKRVAFL